LMSRPDNSPIPLSIQIIPTNHNRAFDYANAMPSDSFGTPGEFKGWEGDFGSGCGFVSALGVGE
jgi:hypothetical protein